MKGISLERLLFDWRWLLRGEHTLLDINDFGDLFLRAADGSVLMLDLQSGSANSVSCSVAEFEEVRQVPANRRAWYFEDLSSVLRKRGFRLTEGKVFGYKTPTCFKESSERRDNIYVADLYEYVSFMGSIHKQMSEISEGEKVRLIVQKS